ncbi:hypothetical protein D3C86_1832980 [compost metagenome]
MAVVSHNKIGFLLNRQCREIRILNLRINIGFIRQFTVHVQLMLFYFYNISRDPDHPLHQIFLPVRPGTGVMQHNNIPPPGGCKAKGNLINDQLLPFIQRRLHGLAYYGRDIEHKYINQ